MDRSDQVPTRLSTQTSQTSHTSHTPLPHAAQVTCPLAQLRLPRHDDPEQAAACIRPQQVWGTLSPLLQARIRRVLLHVTQELLLPQAPSGRFPPDTSAGLEQPEPIELPPEEEEVPHELAQS